MRDLLEFVAERFNLSARTCGRIPRVARTIADLESTHAITVHHVSEALLFRRLDGEGLDVYASSTPRRHSRDERPSSDLH
jgi:predicted ATPase with chaperone activity